MLLHGGTGVRHGHLRQFAGSKETHGFTAPAQLTDKGLVGFHIDGAVLSGHRHEAVLAKHLSHLVDYRDVVLRMMRQAKTYGEHPGHEMQQRHALWRLTHEWRDSYEKLVKAVCAYEETIRSVP